MSQTQFKRVQTFVQHFPQAPGMLRPAENEAFARRRAASPGKRPALVRRVLAELIDRLVPLPFIIVGYFWPEWLAVLFAWHLLRDCSPQRRSLGKWLCRLRVARRDGAPCGWRRAALRRVGSALSQTAYCLPGWMVWAFVYDLATLACALLSPAGQRLEDWVAGTVVTGRQRFEI